VASTGGAALLPRCRLTETPHRAERHAFPCVEPGNRECNHANTFAKALPADADSRRWLRSGGSTIRVAIPSCTPRAPIAGVHGAPGIRYRRDEHDMATSCRE